jgi:hypothetical protein
MHASQGKAENPPKDGSEGNSCSVRRSLRSITLSPSPLSSPVKGEESLKLMSHNYRYMVFCFSGGRRTPFCFAFALSVDCGLSTVDAFSFAADCGQMIVVRAVARQPNKNYMMNIRIRCVSGAWGSLPMSCGIILFRIFVPDSGSPRWLRKNPWR